ncbi:GntR family transcriptional regulator [Roseomonas sp. GC11]|uniref:GntR family transcriptional regulator n=1 Tax=Roseomonas sp. GC11 TaxID=2950546 RepID=UPI00210A0388|nr:GntR family transcriptional regulator [Roseomonas sp. GC11]MCQ4160060.1 GntR family transcriptional regulator [Roseomonas sp. GC11]
MPPVKSLSDERAVPAARAALPVPLYEHVKRLISEQILMGAWPPGTPVPGEVALAAQYGVAVGTVRRALADLVAEGLLARRRKLGTIVTGRAPQHSLRFFFQYFRLHGADGSLLHSETRVLSVRREAASDSEAAAFGGAGEVIRIHRLRLLRGVPAMHERIALPAARLPDFPLEPAAVPALLYRHLLEHYGIRVSAVREQVTAALATPEDARLLGLTGPEALLVIHDTGYDQAGDAAIQGEHRALTRETCYLNEVR